MKIKQKTVIIQLFFSFQKSKRDKWLHSGFVKRGDNLELYPHFLLLNIYLGFITWKEAILSRLKSHSEHEWLTCWSDVSCVGWFKCEIWGVALRMEVYCLSCTFMKVRWLLWILCTLWNCVLKSICTNVKGL